MYKIYLLKDSPEGGQTLPKGGQGLLQEKGGTEAEEQQHKGCHGCCQEVARMQKANDLHPLFMSFSQASELQHPFLLTPFHFMSLLDPLLSTPHHHHHRHHVKVDALLGAAWQYIWSPSQSGHLTLS